MFVMNQKNIAIAAILAAALLAGIFSATPPMAVYAEDDYDDEHDDDERDYDMDNDDNGRDNDDDDNGRDNDDDDNGRDNDDDDYNGDGDESETNTEQKLKQENVGSGASTNFNCGENSIDSGLIDAQLCGTLTLDLGRGMVAVPGTTT
jgi:hypothetical protein